MTVHYLKIKAEYYTDVEIGLKTFELRKNDRNFQVGDVLMLIKLDDKGNETDQVIKKKVKYILKDCPQYGLKEGYAILGIDTGNLFGGTVALPNGGVGYIKNAKGDIGYVNLGYASNNAPNVTKTTVTDAAGFASNGDVMATMKESKDIKQRIDEAEKELRKIFTDLIYEHCDNGGEYELNNLASGFNTLLKYAREWQKINKEDK